MGRRRKEKYDTTSLDEEKIVIDGVVVQYNSDINSLFQYMLMHIPVQYSPLEVIQENVSKVVDLFSEFCWVKKELLVGADRTKVTKQGNEAVKMRDRWLKITDKNVLLAKFYDKLLSLEGTSTLHGFTAVTRFGDRLYGDPEKIPVAKMRSRL
jgi:hypothetical protein